MRRRLHGAKTCCRSLGFKRQDKRNKKQDARSSVCIRDVKSSMNKHVVGFKDLIAYQKAYELSLEIHKLSLNFPRIEQFAIADQIRRASKSIALNIAESYSRKLYTNLAEFRRFTIIAQGSCDETRALLDYCKDLNYISYKQHQNLDSKCQEIGRLLHSMRTKWT